MTSADEKKKQLALLKEIDALCKRIRRRIGGTIDVVEALERSRAERSEGLGRIGSSNDDHSVSPKQSGSHE